MSVGEHKKMPFNTRKKIFALVFAISTLASIFGLSYFGTKTQIAHAQVVDVPVGGVSIYTMTANSVAQIQKELTFDTIVSMASKLMLRSVTNSVVSWINSGFQGSPAFVTDPAAFLGDVADQTAGEFIAGTDLNFLCEPFSLDIRLALNIGYSSTFVDKNQCRLTGVVNNVENFAEYTSGNFSQGGWDAWFEITQNPQNNPLGGFIEAQNELSIRTARGQNIEVAKLNWSGGFLSYQECLEENTDGSCKKKGPIQTPGKVIEEQLNNTLGSGQRQLEVADELDEIVNALVGQLVQTVLTQGLSSFSPGGSNSSTLETPLSVSCSPSKTNATVEENIRWTATVFGGTGATTYSWTGTDGLSGNTASVDIIYGTQGTKSGTVTVTKGNETVTQDCLSNVSIPTGPLPPPLDVACSPDRTNAQIGESVTWSASVIGVSNDSGPVNYNWSGSDPINGATSEQVTLSYTDPGTKTASVAITRNGQTVSRSCSQQVEIPIPPLSATCAPNITTARVGETVSWTATVAGLNASQTQPSYSWSGTSPVGGINTQVASVAYPTTGTKTANVRVSRYGQTVTPRCSPNVRIIP